MYVPTVASRPGKNAAAYACSVASVENTSSFAKAGVMLRETLDPSSRHVILDVTFALEQGTSSRPIRYAELARALAVEEGRSAPLGIVRQTVIELRRKKGMVLDPADPGHRTVLARVETLTGEGAR